MSRYIIWNKNTQVITPKGEVLSPAQWIERYPAAGIDGVDFIVGDGVVNGRYMMEYNATIAEYARRGCSFSECVTKQDHLDAIEAFEDTPPEEVVSAEERIAAALEFQVLASLPDEGVV